MGAGNDDELVRDVLADWIGYREWDGQNGGPHPNYVGADSLLQRLSRHGLAIVRVEEAGPVDA